MSFAAALGGRLEESVFLPGARRFAAALGKLECWSWGNS